MVYPGPVFPNTFQELDTLHNGTFYIIDTEDDIPFEKIDIKIILRGINVAKLTLLLKIISKSLDEKNFLTSFINII